MRTTSLRLEWIPALATDNSVVDDQHQHLFDLYNEILAAPEDQLDRDQVLESLKAYALVHFQDEEAWMESIGYPREALVHHTASHAVFVRELDRLRTAPVYQTLDYFREWLLRHIMAEDRQIRVFLRAAQPQ